MSSAPLNLPRRLARRPWWQPLASLAITLYGVLADGWGMKAIILLFWWETFLLIGAGLVRAAFAFDGKGILATLPTKLVVLPFGVVMGGAIIMLTVVFSFEGMNAPGDDSLGQGAFESQMLFASYVIGLVVHYFFNGRFRAANPAGEMMLPLFHMTALLSLIMPITMHLLPSYPHLDQARWVALTVVAVKFVVDSIFGRFQDRIKQEVAEAVAS